MEFVSKEIQQYAESMTSPESEILADLNRETWLKVLYPRMLSGHLQGALLSMLSKMQRPRRILEIGTYTGYSAIRLAEGLQEGGELITIELDPELKDYISRYVERAGMQDRIRLLIGNARELVKELEGPFDMVFMDADKQGYCHYYEQVLPKMAPGGIILADNVLWSGRVLDENVNDKETRGLRDFANLVAQDEAVEQVLLPVRDGIMVIRKK